MNFEQQTQLTAEQLAALARARMRQRQQQAIENGLARSEGRPAPSQLVSSEAAAGPWEQYQRREQSDGTRTRDQGALSGGAAADPQLERLNAEQRRRRELELLEADRRGGQWQQPSAGYNPQSTTPEQAAALTRAALERRRAQAEQPKPWTQTLWENVVGDNDPNKQNTGERIGAMLNKAGEAMTFGLIGDEASGAAAAMIPGGMGYEERRDFERQQEEVLERDNPGMALGADVGGSLMGALLPMGAMGTLARGAGLAPRLGASAATGATGGAAFGFMEGEGLEDRKADATVGGKIGAAAGVAAVPVGGLVQRAADAVAGRRAITSAAQNAPSSDELRTMGQAAYRQIDDAGVQIKPEAFNRTRQAILDALRSRTGFDELPGPGSLTPNSGRVMQIMDEASGKMAQEPTAALPFRSLDQMRRQAGAAAGNVTNKADQSAGMTVIEGLDDFVQRMGPDDVVAGDVQALKEAIPRARDLWSRMSRSQLVDDAMAQEGNYLSGGSSAIRNQFAKILRNPKTSRGFSEAEKAAMRRVVQGTMPEQVMNLLGGGLGQLTQIGAGFGIGGLPGAAIGAGAAALSRKGSEAITRRNAEIARAIIANGQMRGGLPVASESKRQMVEAMIRRTGAAVPSGR